MSALFFYLSISLSVIVFGLAVYAGVVCFILPARKEKEKKSSTIIEECEAAALVSENNSNIIKRRVNEIVLDGRCLRDISPYELLELYDYTEDFNPLHVPIRNEFYRRLEFGPNKNYERPSDSTSIHSSPSNGGNSHY